MLQAYNITKKVRKTDEHLLLDLIRNGYAHLFTYSFCKVLLHLRRREGVRFLQKRLTNRDSNKEEIEYWDKTIFEIYSADPYFFLHIPVPARTKSEIKAAHTPAAEKNFELLVIKFRYWKVL